MTGFKIVKTGFKYTFGLFQVFSTKPKWISHRITQFFPMTEGKQVKTSCHLAKLEFPKWLWLKMSFLHRHSSHAINHPFFQSCWSYTRYYANTAKQKAEFKTKKLRTENYPTVFHSKLKILLLNFIITFLYHFVLLNVCKYFSHQFINWPKSVPRWNTGSPF